MLGGDLDIYRALEAKLAVLKHKESAVLFATGYLTNLGVLSSLVKSSQLARLYGFKPQRHYSYTYFHRRLQPYQHSRGDPDVGGKIDCLPP